MISCDKKYLNLLAKEYPTKQAVCREIINLNAILNLPKGTEHFMSDLHGEYEAFLHILNNCSGVVKEKVDMAFEDSLLPNEKCEICTLIYYPREKLKMLHKERELTEEWYKMTLNQLIEVARNLSSKYTRSKVRKAMPKDFAYIIDELIHVPKDEDDNRIHHREAEKYKDNIRYIIGKTGNHYQFKTNNMPWLHNTIVWCNGAIIFVFPIGFAHNYNFSKFCNWVVNSIFGDKC